MKRFAVVAALAACFTCFTGCAARVQHITNLPAGVSEQMAKNYDTAVAGLHKIALTTSAVRKAVIDLRNAGAFPDEKAFGGALQALWHIDEAQLRATAYLRDAPEYFAEPQRQKLSDIFSSVAEQIQAFNASGATGIKNPDSLAKINNLIAELDSTIKIVLALGT